MGTSIAVDNSGNVFTTGGFGGTVDFNPDGGEYNLVGGEVFVSKLSITGAFVWAVSLATQAVSSITVDGNGNVITTGVLNNVNVDFDPGAAEYLLSSTLGYDIYVWKLAGSNGGFIWAKKMGGNGNEYGKSIAIDNSGNIYTSGYFTDALDFDPGPGNVTLTPTPAEGGAFLSKLNSSGDFVSVRQIRFPQAHAIDNTPVTGGIYFTGTFGNTLDFDPGAGTFNMTGLSLSDIYILKLTTGSVADTDGDGVPDASDNCPFNSNANQLDTDGDGIGNVCDDDDDNDGTLDANDCAPLNAAIHPGATETCNGVDDDCDGQIDEGVKTTYYRDVDGDGYGNASVITQACSQPSGYVLVSGDCNDANGAIHPGATETCNGVDDDCDGEIDESVVTATITPSGTIDLCSGNSILLSANTGAGFTYQWYKNNKAIRNETSSTLLVTANGNYTVRVFSGSCPPSTSSATVVSVITAPKATISFRGSTDICSSGSLELKANKISGATYQWNKNGTPIAGATQQNYTATEAGSYTVTISKSGCSATSTPVIITDSCATRKFNKPGIITEAEIPLAFNIYPNPSSGQFYVSLNLQEQNNAGVNIKVTDISGKLIYDLSAAAVNGYLYKQISLPNYLAKGIYIIKVAAGKKMYVSKLLISK